MFNLHPLFKFFNSDRPRIPSDNAQWPDAWKKVEYKIYPRMPQIKLPAPELGEWSLVNAILKRKSERVFSATAMNLKELSTLLFLGAGITRNAVDTTKSRRSYPSGGARYPIEIYVVSSKIKDLGVGIYHYNVLQHSLELLGEAEKRNINSTYYYEFGGQAAAVFIFTMVPWRSVRKYGNFAFKVALIEAGHLAEHMYLVSTALNLKCCAMGGMHEKAVCELLDIDGTQEIPFYMLAFGN